MTRARTLRVLAAVAVWMLIALPGWAFLFTHTSASMVLASHDTVVTPHFGSESVLRLGPYLPDVRIHSGGHVAVSIRVGKTTGSSVQELVSRYAVIATHPSAEVRRIRGQVTALALDAALRAAVIGLVPIGAWLLLGPQRRRQVFGPTRRHVVVAATVAAVVVVAVWEPWSRGSDRVQSATWIPLQEAIPQVHIPEGLDRVEVQGGMFTTDTQRLIKSVFATYDKSEAFYKAVRDQAPALASRFHQPAPGDTVGVLVSDRHDNIGMDQPVAALAEQAGATVVIDAGDDTSSGGSWEAFSLDSLDEAFEDFKTRLYVAGNHDFGGFVDGYLAKLGWTHLDGKEITPFGDVSMIGVDDPRADGLGPWTATPTTSFDEVRDKLSAQICALQDDGHRVATVVVHDASMALPALESGCTDLVVGGHLHVQVGPDRIVGGNGEVGYRYTNGTTGGAALGFSLGSKLRRDAEFTMLTWHDGRPVGIQPVVVRTTGQVKVRKYIPLRLTP